MSRVEIYGVVPFPEGVGSLGNAFYFVILVGVGASLLYLLLKRNSLKLITFIICVVFTAAVFMLATIYLLAALSRFNISNLETLVLIISLFITVLADLAVFRNSRKKVCNMVILCLAGALGAFFGFSIPTLSAMLILIFLAVYDVFAVYHGPVGKIAQKGLENLHGLSLTFKDVQIGLGDLTFYSMLSGHALFNFGPFACLGSVIGILFGCMLSFKMLEKKGIFPGMPLPILFGLTASFLLSFMF
jgi:presenilin-like A22 family membrane protease